MPTPTDATHSDEIPSGVAVRVAPLHKLALGVSCGIVAGLLLAVLTLVHQARTDEVYPLVLLAEYLYGYSVTPLGALIGAFWGFWIGFFGGWFFAFVRNFVVGLTFVLAQARADLGSDVLDHI